MNDRGSAVVAAVANITLATLITLSVLALILSAHNTLLIRNAVVEAASKAVLSEAPSQQPYLMRLLETNLPHLSSFDVEQGSSGRFLFLKASAQLPGLGMLGGTSQQAVVLGAREALG